MILLDLLVPLLKCTVGYHHLHLHLLLILPMILLYQKKAQLTRKSQIRIPNSASSAVLTSRQTLSSAEIVEPSKNTCRTCNYRLLTWSGHFHFVFDYLRTN